MQLQETLIPFSEAFREAFNEPQDIGTWLIWGQSGSGKSTFVVQLLRELAEHYTVVYNSLEEGFCHTFKTKLKDNNIEEVGENVLFVNETMEELNNRLQKRRSPHIVIIDSLQYTGMNFNLYKEIKKRFPRKLFIFISHAEGKQPAGRVGRQVMYDAALKIYVEGYRAFSKGREIGPNGGVYTIWEEGAERVWGDKINNNQNQEP